MRLALLGLAALLLTPLAAADPVVLPAGLGSADAGCAHNETPFWVVCSGQAVTPAAWARFFCFRGDFRQVPWTLCSARAQGPLSEVEFFCSDFSARDVCFLFSTIAVLDQGAVCGSDYGGLPEKGDVFCTAGAGVAQRGEGGQVAVVRDPSYGTCVYAGPFEDRQLVEACA